jgi:hypothetical protein
MYGNEARSGFMGSVKDGGLGRGSNVTALCRSPEKNWRKPARLHAVQERHLDSVTKPTNRFY